MYIDPTFKIITRALFSSFPGDRNELGMLE